MKQFIRNRIFFSLLVSVTCFTAAVSIDALLNRMGNDPARMAQGVEIQLHALERECGQLADRLIQAEALQATPEYYLEHKASLEKKGIYFLVFEKDSLRFWSDNRVAFYRKPDPALLYGGLIRMNNGWYESFPREKEGKSIVVLLLIKNEYAFQNRYLKNEFNDLFRLPYNAELGPKKDNRPGARDITGEKGEFLFSLFIPEGPSRSRSSWFTTFLYIVSFCAFAFFIHATGKHIGTNTRSLWKTGAVIAGVLLLRIGSFYFQVPDVLYNKPIFSPQYYASSSILSSLGDLLVNALLVFYVVLLLYKRIRLRDLLQPLVTRKAGGRILLFAGALLVFYLSAWVNYLLYGLVIHSSIIFSVKNVFELDGNHLYSFIIMGLLLFTFYIIVTSFIRAGIVLGIRTFEQVIITIAALAVFIPLAVFGVTDVLEVYNSYTFVWTVFLLLTAYYLRNTTRVSYPNFFMLVFLFSVYVTTEISSFNAEKANNNRVLLARKLESEQDPIAEFLFEDVEGKILSDTTLHAQLENEEQVATAVKRIQQFFSNSYWGKYDLKIHIFDENGEELTGSMNEKYSQLFFEELIREQGNPMPGGNLFLLLDESGRTSYVARLTPPVRGPDVMRPTVFIELDSRFLQEEGGFPELLLSDRVAISKQREGADYSYGIYKNGQLVNQHGPFTYFLRAGFFPAVKEGSWSVFEKEGYSHLLYQPDSGTLVVFTREQITWIDLLTLFSYFFALFSFFLFIMLVFRQMPVDYRPFRYTFRNRIQLSMLLMVILSLVLVGAGTVYYITGSYDIKQNEELGKRFSGLAVAVEGELQSKAALGRKLEDELVFEFARMSGSFTVDFGIYNLEGLLLYSSQPRIYEQGILAPRINPEALFRLQNLQKERFVLSESTGRLHYVSAYEPIRNAESNIIGYLALPYFSRESELKQEISVFLATLINIYILLFSLSVAIAFLISGRMTEPLRFIQSKLGQIHLGKSNEPIVWNRRDEIGELVAEYNRMVEELTKSAEMLARSERESAWREMAKQVAHEIKNPLTPMKLSVQHLQKAWEDKSPHMDEIIGRISKTLIQQIDTLSGIATEFSNFAKMPRAMNEEIDLQTLLANTINLFKDTPGIEIWFAISDAGIMVFADRDQLVRVFTNLLRNAIQAIPEGRKGIIEITMTAGNGYCTVAVGDNGQGITDEQRQKIFVPNFTTKTGGMGLGLAMVKNIVETAGGKVWFQTRVGEGSTFYVSLPLQLKD